MIPAHHLSPARSRRLAGSVVALALLLPALPGPVDAQEAVPTRVVVRAVSNDAKILGSGVGGARVMIRDAVTGRILASGVQEGGTGDTGAIMGDRTRGGRVFDAEGAAAFEATLHLTAPTQVVVEAEGPLGPMGEEASLQHASTTLLLVPGHHVVGEGVILTLHGFTVDVVQAPAAARAGAAAELEARVTMLCGCPTEPGGLWDSDRYVLELALVRGDAVLATGDLVYTGETSHYRGTVDVPDDLTPGDYGLRVVAVDAERANAGMRIHPIRIER